LRFDLGIKVRDLKGGSYLGKMRLKARKRRCSRTVREWTSSKQI